MARLSQKQIDAVGIKYRSLPAVMSQAEAARHLNVSLSTLRGWIAKYNWDRDLGPEVRRRTNMAVQKAMLGAPLDRPLSDEDTAIAERVAVNVSLLTAQQEWLGGFGESLTLLMQHHLEQTRTMEVAIPDAKAPSGYRVVRKSLGAGVGEARQLISAFGEFAEQQRRAFGISDDGDANKVDVDTALRQLAEEMAAEEAAELELNTGEAETTEDA